MSEEKSDFWIWGKTETKPRILHTMTRVKDLEKSIEFYCECLGMKELSRFDSETGRFTLCFLGYDDFSSPCIELTHNWDVDQYELGDAYGHLAIGVPNIHEACTRIVEAGYEVTLQPKAMIEGAPKLAFAKDPDGYLIEFIETNAMAPQ